MRMLSVAKSMQPGDAKALRSVIADTTATKVLGGIASAKNIVELPELHAIVLQSATSADDPVLLALVALADDMRKRGDLAHAQAGLTMLAATAKWSAQRQYKIPALDAVTIVLSDFVSLVGRDVVKTATLLEAETQDQKLLTELRVFLSDRMQQLEAASADQSALYKAANWRTEPDALDHPLISRCAKNFYVQLDMMLETKSVIERSRAVKPAR